MPGTGQKAALFLQHDVGITVPNDLWSPVAFNVPRALVNTVEWLGGFNYPAPTTIAAGSNGQVLPQATINVASTAGFANAGYLLIRIGTTDRCVQYTGKTATQFTGCTFGTGPAMTTGDAVRQGLVNFTPPVGTICGLIAEEAWTSNATGVRGTRMRDQSSFQFEAAGDVRGAVATPAAAPLRTWCAEQPGSPTNPAFTGTPFRIEVYQNSTVDLATLQNAASLGYPRLVAAHMVDF